MIMLKPSIERIPDYVSALQRRWSLDNLRREAAQEHIARASKNTASFVSNPDNPTANAGPETLPLAGEGFSSIEWAYVSVVAAPKSYVSGNQGVSL